jgi:hypothetical protein
MGSNHMCLRLDMEFVRSLHFDTLIAYSLILKVQRMNKLPARLTALSLVVAVPLVVHAQQVPTPEDRAAASRANAEQDRQAQQQRDAEQRNSALQAPSVRSTVPHVETYPPPAERNAMLPNRALHARRTRHVARSNASARRVCVADGSVCIRARMACPLRRAVRR